MEEIKEAIVSWLDEIVAKGCKYRSPVEVQMDRQELENGLTLFSIDIYAGVVDSPPAEVTFTSAHSETTLESPDGEE